MKALIAAFIQAQAEFPQITNDSTNPYFKSRYASLESIIDKVKPVLLKHGLGFSQSVVTEGSAHCVITTIYHQSGEFMELGKLGFQFDDLNVHKQAGTIKYARRYALLAALGIAPEGEDDDGNEAVQNGGKGKKAPAGRMVKEHNGSQPDQHSKDLVAALDKQILEVEIPEDLDAIAKNIKACVLAKTISQDQRLGLLEKFNIRKEELNV